MKRVQTGYRPTPRKLLSVSEFRGIDLYNAPTNVSPARSPDAPNMIRDVPGKVRKRMGYFKVQSYGARINGVHRLIKDDIEYEVVHAGSELLLGDEVLYADMADARSKAWQVNGVLYLLDGKRYLRFDGESVEPVSEHAYLPTIVLSRQPSGGGVTHEGVNLIGSKWTESFLSNGSALVYQLSFDELDDDFIEVKKMTAADVWTALSRNVDYTFDAALGTVTFTAAAMPGRSLVDGADNVIITVKKTRDDYEARIDGCDMSVLYGVGGAADRLFVTGSNELRNHDWYSEMNDPTYFPVNNYCVLGLSTRIVAYSIIGERLAAHKSDDEDGRNIIIRHGAMTDGRASFPIIGTLQGAGTVSGDTVAYLKTEPLFLSKSGIYAVTTGDINGERYTQNRSYFINTRLAENELGHEAVAVSFKDFYLLAMGGRLYVLDSLMKSYEEGAPYSTHQYEAYLLTGIDARVLYVRGGRLRFGTPDGDIMEFFSDPYDAASYNDDGAPIEAHWDTPMFSGESFYTRKGFKYLALKLMAAPSTGAEVWVHIKGLWSRLFSEFSRLRYFTFSGLSFSRFTFSCDPTPKAFGRRLTLPKTDKAQFRFYNGNIGEPFGLYNYALEFQAGGRIR